MRSAARRFIPAHDSDVTERWPHKRRWRKLAPGVGLASVAPGDQLPDGAPWSPWSVRHAVNFPRTGAFRSAKGISRQ